MRNSWSRCAPRCASLVVTARWHTQPTCRSTPCRAQSFETFQDLLRGATSYEDIDAKVDALAAEGKLDPALLLTTSKMYMSVKESPYTSEEVKDIMAHLYWRVRACRKRVRCAALGAGHDCQPPIQMRASMAELQPPTVRIMKHVLFIEDPLERRAALEQAFTPGPELTVGAEDQLSTCAPRDARLATGAGAVLTAHSRAHAHSQSAARRTRC